MRHATLIAAAALAIAPATALAVGGAPSAIVPLPASGQQVNDDPTNGIDPTQDAGVSDVVGGSLAGGLNVPWATFEQKTGASQQIFVRSFAAGAFTTRGNPASLNIDPNQEAEAPTIDFAGTGRTVPWVTWYEPNTHLSGATRTNIFASRFNATTNVWLPSGQDRTAGFAVPSLNIHTDRNAKNPAVAGGAAVAGADPVPWVAWQERDGGATNSAAHNQVFVSRAVKQAAAGTPCTGFAPGSGNNVNSFCWQQVGLKRLAADSLTSSATGDPTLSIDPSRNAIEVDMAFTGPSDTVPWVVWYETGDSSLGLRGNEMVFAAKAVADPTADGGFHWVAVGNGTAGQTNLLDRSGAVNHFGACAESQAAEQSCSLNANPLANAEDPRVAAGTLTPGGATVPWVTWAEDIGHGRKGIFVSRLVGGDHFELFNGGNPISNTANDAATPDITFSGNTPYVSWQEDVSGKRKAFVGHFEGGATAPVFVLDTSKGVTSTGGNLDARPPISSSCTASPATSDGAACPAGALGTPFFLFTAGKPGSQKLFMDGFAPSGVKTNAATGIHDTSATLKGAANPGGAQASVHFEFGTTTAYGSSTPAQTLPLGDASVTVKAKITGLTAGTTYHYRLVAQSDFTTVDGPDRTFTTTG
jgi:hypothetical protein